MLFGSAPSAVLAQPASDQPVATEPEPPPSDPPPPTTPAATAEPTPPPPPSPVEPPAVKEAKPVPDLSGAPGKGLTAKFGDAFSVVLRSRIQPRFQLHVPSEDSNGNRPRDQFLGIGTARVWISGNAYRPELTYMLQLALGARDYRDGTVSPIFDALIDYKAHRDASLRIGQFFVPFDRLRTVREFALQLVDRPRVIGELTLDRDTGVIVYSDALGGDKSPFAYRIGAFGGGGPNAVNAKRVGGLFLGRLEWRPLGPIDDDSEGDLKRRDKPALALGIGGAANRNTNRLRSTTGTTTKGKADYWHAAIDATFKWRGFASQFEWLLKRAAYEITYESSVPAEVEYARSGTGWVVQASYVFPKPFEVVGRFSRMHAREGTDPKLIAEVRSLGQEIAGGVNYYLNGHILKLQADWIMRSPRDFNFETTDHLFHMQLDATF